MYLAFALTIARLDTAALPPVTNCPLASKSDEPEISDWPLIVTTAFASNEAIEIVVEAPTASFTALAETDAAEFTVGLKLRTRRLSVVTVSCGVIVTDAEAVFTATVNTPDAPSETASASRFLSNSIATDEMPFAELEKSKLETDKNIDPTKYQEALETQLADSQQRFADLQVKFETTLEARDKEDLDRKKLSAVWDIGRKAGMVDDRELLNFIDKEVVQIDENGVVNIKSAETVINKLKASKPYFFQEQTPDKINDKAPDGTDDTDISTLSFSEQIARKRNQN